nr:hypothetical protein [Tanacetum cinerariifolium]
METHKPLSKDEVGTNVDVHLYRSVIGSLMYLTSSRPDIMFAVCACLRFQVQPKVSHMHAVKRIFRYLKGQPTLGLWYPKDSPLELIAYSDSDYADYGYNFMQTKIHVDNESAIYVVKNLVYHSKTKHIEIRHQFIRDSYDKSLIEMVNIHTDYNVADLLNKAFNVTSAKTTSWNEFSSTMASAIICLTNSQKFNFSKYILNNLKKNLEAGVPFYMFPGTGFFGIVIPLFDTMMVQPVEEVGDLPTVDQDTPIPDAPSSSQPLRNYKPRRKEKKERKETKVFPTELTTEDPVPTLSSDPLPSGEDSMPLKELMVLNTNFSNKVLDLENEVIEMKSSHKAKIRELESTVEKLEEENRRIADINANAEVNLENVYNLDLAHEETVLSMHDATDADDKEVAEEMVEVINTAKIIVDEVSTAGGELNVADEEPVSAAPTNITTAQPSEAIKITVDISTAPKAKGIVFHDVEKLITRISSLKAQVKDKGKAKQSDGVRKYQALKRKLVSVAQARKNMMIYLKNMAGFKMEFFKGMSYEEIRPLFEEEYNKVQTLFKEGLEIDEERIKALRKITRKEEEAEELKRNLEIVPDDEDDVFVNVAPLSSKPPIIVDYKIYKEGKKEHFQIIRANGNYYMYLAFSSILRTLTEKILKYYGRLSKTGLKRHNQKKS